MDRQDPSSERLDSHDAIMEATYRALCKHGYADLSMQNIADEFEKSKSLLYYHYDDKDDLLTDTFRHLIGQFMGRLGSVDDEDPYAELQSLVDQLLPATMDDEERQFRTALLEIEALTTRNERFRAEFVELNEAICAHIVDIVERGVAEGQFVDADAARVADFVVSTVEGTIERYVLLGDDAVLVHSRTALAEYLQAHLLAADEA